MWQDIVFSIGSLLFTFALIPSIVDKYGKPSAISSFMTAIVLSVYAPTMFTLGLYWSTFCTSLTALAWWVLLYQRLKRDGMI